MEVHLLDESEGESALLQYVESRDWWMCITCDATGAEMVSDIVEVAGDEASALMMVPTRIGPVPVTFIRKDRCSRAQLNAIGVAATDDHYDVLLMSEDSNIDLVTALGYAVNDVFIEARGKSPSKGSIQ